MPGIASQGDSALANQVKNRPWKRVNSNSSFRMAKQRQMRWTDEGAHVLAQVRVHAINGDLRPKEFAFPLRPPKPVHSPSEDAHQMRMTA